MNRRSVLGRLGALLAGVAAAPIVKHFPEVLPGARLIEYEMGNLMLVNLDHPKAGEQLMEGLRELASKTPPELPEGDPWRRTLLIGLYPRYSSPRDKIVG